ncbi:hypothetical protein G6F57_015404 [Rhizopus arrhizus]|nr:hypothetical protein G6F57_015404 [Rhizopus arrhizus]
MQPLRGCTGVSRQQPVEVLLLVAGKEAELLKGPLFLGPRPHRIGCQQLKRGPIVRRQALQLGLALCGIPSLQQLAQREQRSAYRITVVGVGVVAEALLQQQGKKRSTSGPGRQEQVALAAHRLDPGRVAWIVLQLPPQLAHAPVPAAGPAGEVDAAHAVEQGGAAEHLATAAGQRPEHLEFAGGQLQALPTQLHGAAAAVDVQRIEAQPLVIGLRLCRAPQQRAQPCQQHRWLHRLDDIVIGAGFQAQHMVQRVVAGGQHQHRDVAERAQVAAHLQSITAGQHQIQYHHVRLQ